MRTGGFRQVQPRSRPSRVRRQVGTFSHPRRRRRIPEHALGARDDGGRLRHARHGHSRMLRHTLDHGRSVVVVVGGWIGIDALGLVVRIAGPVGASGPVQGAVVEIGECHRRSTFGGCRRESLGNYRQRVRDDRGCRIPVPPTRDRRVPYQRGIGPRTRSTVQHARYAHEEGVRGRGGRCRDFPIFIQQATTAQAYQIAAKRGGQRARSDLSQIHALALHPKVLLRRRRRAAAAEVVVVVVVRPRRVQRRRRLRRILDGDPPSSVQSQPNRGAVRGRPTSSIDERIAIGVPPTHIREAIDRPNTARDDTVVGDIDEVPTRGVGRLSSGLGGTVQGERRGEGSVPERCGGIRRRGEGECGRGNDEPA